ncbi:MAG: endonuclease/exonuclease/phosphatase family protein [Saprospiraceae bacterium]|nr:endonuclease/exonuclease/phosphatase family protein [Saprospiraceae bacterium]
MYNKFIFAFVVFVLSYALSTVAQTQDPKTVARAKIVTWNIQMLPNSLAFLSNALRKKQCVRTPWIIDHCLKKDYDVIVFQEVFDLDIKRKLKKGLKDSYPYQVNTKTKAGRIISNGILIVSRLPMKYIDHVIYAKGAHTDGFSAKGCTLVEVEKKDLKFHIAGTHLQSGGSKAAIMHRDLQFQEIRNLLDSNILDQVPVFVMGDMNTRKSNTEKYPKMIEVIGVNDYPLDESAPYTYDANNSWNNNDVPVQIDYVLLQARKTNTKILKQKVLRPKHNYKGKPMDLADHYGIVAEIEVSN